MQPGRWNAFTEGGPPHSKPPRDESQLEEQFRRIGELQRHLLPREIPQPAGWEIAAYYKVSPWPSGDYYDFLPLPDGRLVMLVADASGHGGPSAVMMAITRVTLHACPLSSGRERQPFCPLQGTVTQSPHVVLGHLNRVLIENSLEGQFMTAFYAVLNPADGTLHYANAGHPSPLWWRASSRTVETVHDVGGVPLGLEPHIGYHQGTMEIEPGDALVFYSDGLTEAQKDQDELFGRHRLEAALRESVHRGAEGVKSCVLNRLDEFLVGKDPQDDVTAVVLQRMA